MQNKAIVINATGDIEVVPMLGDVCISCERTGCAKHGTPFKVSNPEMFNLKKGDIVHLHAKVGAKTAQGLFALFFPLAASVGAYFAAGHRATEGAKAGAVLIALALASAVVIAVSSVAKHIRRAEIIAVES
ncbi:MAG: hypothetical protein Ta2A_04350 [Treponemataceae bacterium]|nr:MAG: hypothetical protein Ta2A_04350 [Treponemataceae bacterium]